MNEQRFFELLSAYGADLSRWPAEDGIAADRFLAGASHRVKDIWESERAFDRILAAEHDAPASVSLEARILLQSPSPALRTATLRRRFGFWDRRQWAAGGVVAASLLMGVAAGYAATPASATSADYGAMLSLSSGGASAVFLSAMNEPEMRAD